MIINNIKIHNFKSIANLVMDFTAIPGLYEITGNVGAGKTTLSEALLFGLFGTIRNKNNKDLVRWGEKSCSIVMDVVSNGHQLIITRTIKGSTSTLDVAVDGEPLIFTNKKDAQKQLETEYYDTSRLIVETLFIISFNNFKSISTMSPQDTKEFLDKILNLHIITEYVARCKESIKELQVSDKVEKTNIELLKKQIDTFNRLRNDIVVSDNDYINLCNNLEELKKKKQRYDDARTKKLTKVQNEVTNVKTQQATKVQQQRRVQDSISFINKKVCPTCGAPIDNSNLSKYQDEYAVLQSEIQDLNNQVKQRQDEYNSIVTKSKEAIHKLDDEISKIIAEITKYKQHQSQVKAYTDTIQEIEDSLKSVVEDNKNTECDILQYTELSDLLSYNIRTSIINNAIPLINQNVEYYTYKLGLPYQIMFDSDFKCVINTPLRDGIPITSLSTGQMKTVDMIIILAILKVLLGSFNMNVVFLDELFSNLDSSLRDVMCGILKEELKETYTKGHKMTTFVISHSPLNETLLDGMVYVDRCVNNNESNYNVVTLHQK